MIMGKFPDKSSCCPVCLLYCCFVGSCFEDVFKTPHSISVQIPLNFSSNHFARVQGVHPYSNTDMATDLKQSRFFLKI